jgi:hypothetical protein
LRSQRERRSGRRSFKGSDSNAKQAMRIFFISDPSAGAVAASAASSLPGGTNKQLNRMVVSGPAPAKAFTPKQGQYLAYIYAYTRLHRRPPAEIDMQEYFRVTPPSVHQMVLTLERQGFIKRQPRTARSIELLVDPKLLPDLLDC